MSGEPLRGPWGAGIAQPVTDLGLAAMPLSRLAQEPPRYEWMVEGCFLRGTVALISGDGGIGKSLCLQQLASSAVLGRDWLGLPVRAGRVLFFGCEDDADELHRRQWRINRALGVPMDDLIEAGLELVPRVGQDNALVSLNRQAWRIAPTSLFERLAQRCQRNGIQYLILDTATHVFRGNQNDETQVLDFISELRRLAIRIQGVVLVTKHPSLSGLNSGSGLGGNVQWNNAVRSRLYLYEHKALGLVLEGKKSNYGKRGDKIALRWQRGVFVTEDAPRYTDPYA